MSAEPNVWPFPTIERVADDMRLLMEVGLPAEWSLRHQRTLKLMIDRTAKPLQDLTIGEVLDLARAVRSGCDANPDAKGGDDDDVC